jgi:hypothetical protein
MYSVTILIIRCKASRFVKFWQICHFFQNHTDSAVRDAFPPPVHTDIELGKLAGVSHTTIQKARKIAEKAPEPIKEQLRRGEISINAAH